MSAVNIIAAINTITDEKEADEIYRTAWARWAWCREEKGEEKRKKVLYDTFLDFPPTTKVKFIGTGYVTLDGKTGTVTELESQRGYDYTFAHVQLDRGKGPRSLQCGTHTGCLRVVAGSATPTAWGRRGRVIEVIND